MTDLFAAAETQPDPDLTVKWRRVPNSAAYFLAHPCCVCGATTAPFGEGVSFRRGTPGRWRCRTHWDERRAGKRGVQG